MMAADPAGFAPAKVNLFLHLGGRRADGYHLLTSLVVFPEIGDALRVEPSDALSLTIGGPFAAGLSTDGNLVTRAARALAAHHRIEPCAALHLEKRLPVASGIGGGSSDAAAALRLLSAHWGVDVPASLALELGADVPVCLAAPAPRMMSGIGEILETAPALPACWIVLVNPGVEVPTGAVFAGVEDRNPPPGPPVPLDGIADFPAFRDWLGLQRNDLQAPALAICPAIGEALAALAGAPLARMSGSGATCFGLFPDAAGARALAERMASGTDWWVRAAPVLRAP
jgi:4-diphosphocytidyl-2-C-methyl-D-erythritol kinase